MGTLQRQDVQAAEGFSQGMPPGTGLATRRVLATRASSLAHEARVANRNVIVKHNPRVQFSENSGGAALNESPRPGCKRGSLATLIARGILIAGVGLGLTQFGKHVTRMSEMVTAPEEKPDSGNPVEDQITDLWLPQATAKLIKECQDPKAFESVEAIRSYLKDRRQQELWLAITHVRQDKFGRTARISYVLYPSHELCPSQIDDRWFSAFKALVSMLLETPAPASTSGLDFAITTFSVLSPESTEGRDPLDVIREHTVAACQISER